VTGLMALVLPVGGRKSEWPAKKDDASRDFVDFLLLRMIASYSPVKGSVRQLPSCSGPELRTPHGRCCKKPVQGGFYAPYSLQYQYIMSQFILTS